MTEYPNIIKNAVLHQNISFISVSLHPCGVL